MSASSLALAIAPSPGTAPSAARRGVEPRAEATGDDFARVLDEATTTDTPTPAPARASPTIGETATAEAPPVEIAPAEDAVGLPDAPIPALIPTPFPPLTPTVAPVAPTVVVASPAPSVADAAPADPATPPLAAGPDLPMKADGLQAPPASDAAESSPRTAPAPDRAAATTPTETARAEATVTAATTAALAPPRPAPTPTAAVIAPPRATRAAAADLTAVTPPADVAEAGAPAAPPAGSSSIPAEAPRTRDIIDRAQPARAETPAPSVETDAAAPPAQPSSPTADKAATPTPAASARPGPVAPDLAPAPLEAESSTSAAPTTETARIEARAAEASTLALSTTSRASIETTAQIAAQIVRKLEGRSTRFEMALTPDDLGRVDISLDIDADGQLAARLAFDNPVAATELRGRVDELRRQLQEAGFTVADDALSFAQRDASAGQGGFGRGAFDRGHDRRNARAFGAASRLSAEADLAAAPARWIPLTLTPERVDMKV